jgi:DTW domain-containing protein YfiP
MFPRRAKKIPLLVVVLVTASLIHKTNSFLRPRNNNNNNNGIVIRKTSVQLSSIFLTQVEETIRNVNPAAPATTVSAAEIKLRHELLPPHKRESMGVANHLAHRIKSLHKNNDCPSCWLQRAHCICAQTPPIPSDQTKNVHRLFLLMHHKEIGLVVDTAKLLLNAMPCKARLIVSGIGEEYQESVLELKEAMEQKERRCIVLFPTDHARTFEELCTSSNSESKSSKDKNGIMPMEKPQQQAEEEEEMFDVIVLDGTWSQARKMHSRYIPLEEDGGPPRVCLSQEALDILGGTTTTTTTTSSANSNNHNGRQLRRHPIKWKEVSTLEATRLLFRDMMIQSTSSSSSGRGEELEHACGGGGANKKDGTRQCHAILAEYQRISDAAAVKQLGPPRLKIK